MQTNSQKRESIEITVLSLLLARKRPCTLTQLTKDYYEMEGGHIPWRELGYHSLFNLLQSMPKSVFIDHRDNMIFVSGIASDKSKHVSKLVAGQKEQKHIVGRRLYKPSHYYPHTGHQRIHIPAEILTMIISYVNENPDGVNKDYVLKKVQSHMPYTQISMSDMEEQLQKLAHQIYLSHNKIFPAQSKLNNVYSNTAIVTASGNEDSDDMIDDGGDEDDFQFVPSGYKPDPSQTKVSAKNMSTSNFIKETVSKCQDQVPQAEGTEHMSRMETDQMNSCNSHKYGHNDTDQSKMELNNNLDNENYFDGKNVDILINERVKFRLEKLIQNHPEGIWCADLPEKYLEEYKVSLNYTELGFNSVREFASQLPETFHCVQPYDTGDFMLYYAKQDIPSSKSKEKQKLTLAEMHNIYMKEDDDALPLSLTLDTCKKLIPDGIVTIGECVGQLSVEDLLNIERPYIEVVVVEVFSPSFFWIQLRKKQKAFTQFMDDLNHFYTRKHENYIIPPVVLEKGLNCACIYNEVWHRGIIITVSPDLQVTVMFYDYGTLKTYPADAVFYLHRMFSSIPAQAIPCGLINTRPYKGTKWSRSVTHHFAVRTSQLPLIATIASINSEDNSMMVTLTDTLGEEDVHINDWLVEQKLAEHGKMVCMRHRNFPFRYYLECQERFKQKCETSKASKTVESKECKKSAHSGNYSKNAVALYNLKSTSANDLRRASRNDVHRSDITLEKSRDSTLNVTEKGPRALKSLYEKLLDIKRSSTSSKDNSKKERNDTAEGNEFSSSDSAANDTAKRKFGKKSFNNNVASNNNKCDVFTSDLTNSNRKEINEYVEYDILQKFNSIPKTYANHFLTHNSDDELGEPCIGSLTDKNNKQCELEEIDWSTTVRKNIAGKKQCISQQHATTKTYKSIPTERENIPLAESSFLNVVRNSVNFALRDEEIHWSPTGNVDRNPDISPAVLKNIKKRAACCTKEMTVGIPQKMLELLRGRKLAEKPLESINSKSTNASENCINEPLSSCSSQGISSVTADASSCSNDGDTFCTETSQSNSSDCASGLENDYVCVTPCTPKHKLLHRLFMMQQRLRDTSELDSDDLSASDSSESAQKHMNDSNEKSKLEDRGSYVILDESISNVSYSEIIAKDPPPSSEIEDTSFDAIESSVLAEESVPIQDQSALTEESISFSTSVFTGESEVQHETLEEEESIEESIQTGDPLLTEETISSELVPRRESLPPNVIADTPNIPVFNDIDLGSDSDEWDLQVSVADMCELLNINRSIGMSNQMGQKSDEGLQIEEVNDSDREDTNIPENDQKNDVREVIRSEDQIVNNEKFNETQKVVIDLENNLEINDKDNSGPTNTSLVPWKSQGKARTLINMLKKGDKVDMSNLLLYVEESLPYSPEQYYEEEIDEDKGSNKNSEEEAVNAPLVSPQSTLNDNKSFTFPSEIPLRDDLHKLPVIREETLQDRILKDIAMSVASPSSQTNTNPFLYDETNCNQVANELTPEKFIQLWTENVKLQMQITATFHLLLNRAMKYPDSSTGDNLIKNEQILDMMRNTLLHPNKDMPVSANLTMTNNSSTYPATIPPISNSYNNAKTAAMNYDFMNTGYPTGSFTFTDANQQKLLYNASNYKNNFNCSNSADFFQNSGIQNSARNLTPMYPNSVVPADNNIGAANQFLVDEPAPAKENFTPRFEGFNTQLNIGLDGRHSFPNNVSTDFPTPSNKSINDTKLVKDTNPFRLMLAGKLRLSDSDEENSLKPNNQVPASHRNAEPVTEHDLINFENTNTNTNHPNQDIFDNLCKEKTFDYYQYFLTNSSGNVSSNNLSVVNTQTQPTNRKWSLDDVTSNMSRIIINNPSTVHNINLATEVGKHTEKDNGHVLNSNTYNYDTFAHTPYPEISPREYGEKQKQQESLGLKSCILPPRKPFAAHYSDSVQKANEQRSYYTNDSSTLNQSSFAHRNILTTTDRIPNCPAVKENSISSSWSPLNSFIPPVSIDHTNTDEGYLTRPSTSHTSYRSSPLAQVNNEAEHGQQSPAINSNILWGTPNRMWMKSIERPTIIQPENWTKMNCLLKKNDNVNVGYNGSQQQNSSENICIRSAPQPQVNDLYSQESKLQNIWQSPAPEEPTFIDNKSTIQSDSSQTKKVFIQVIELPKRMIHVFHHKGEGWLLMDEFVQAFTIFDTIPYMMGFLDKINIQVPMTEIDRTQYFVEVFKLNGIMLDATHSIVYGTNNLQLMPLRSTLKLLKKMKIISAKDIDDAVKREFTNQVMREIWFIINAYGQLKHRIENEG